MPAALPGKLTACLNQESSCFGTIFQRLGSVLSCVSAQAFFPLRLFLIKNPWERVEDINSKHLIREEKQTESEGLSQGGLAFMTQVQLQTPENSRPVIVENLLILREGFALKAVLLMKDHPGLSLACPFKINAPAEVQ